MRAADIVRYKRACVREWESNGATQETVVSHEYETKDARWRSWLAHSLWEALNDIEHGARPQYTLRSLLKVREYQGRVGGFYPSPSLHDASIEVQNALESLLVGNVPLEADVSP